MRRNFAEILKTAKIDLLQEYGRLYKLFYNIQNDYRVSLAKECEKSFLDMPFRGTCLSLSDFNKSYGFDFESKPKDFDIDYLVVFCEYTYNFVVYLRNAYGSPYKTLYINQMRMVLDMIDYEFIDDEYTRMNILVPRKQESIAVAEIADKKIAYSILEYNHHSLKGNLEKKKAILKLMADDIEPERNKLRSINRTFESNLFQMLQKFVRHNNEEKPYIKGLSPDELEACYDDIYQMWLLAKLEIDNLERKKRVEFVLQKINE